MKGSNSLLFDHDLEWDRVYGGFLLGECDDGRLYLPSIRGRRYPTGERRWARRFNPRNPLHWPRYWNTRRRRAFAYLESVA